MYNIQGNKYLLLELTSTATPWLSASVRVHEFLCVERKEGTGGIGKGSGKDGKRKKKRKEEGTKRERERVGGRESG